MRKFIDLNHFLFLAHCSLYSIPVSYTQELPQPANEDITTEIRLVYENPLDGRDTKTAEDHGFTEIPGGFGNAPVGTIKVGDYSVLNRRQFTPLPLRETTITNRQGMYVNVKHDEVTLVMGETIEVNQLAFFRCYVSAQKDAAITIGLIDPVNSSLSTLSTWTNTDRRLDFSDWKLIYVLFESQSGKVQPVIQVASTYPENRSTDVYIENIQIYDVPKDSSSFRELMDYENIENSESTVPDQLSSDEEIRLVYDNPLNGDFTENAWDHGLTVIPGGFGSGGNGGITGFGSMRIFFRRIYLQPPEENESTKKGVMFTRQNPGDVRVVMGEVIKSDHPSLFRFHTSTQEKLSITAGLFDPDNPGLTALSTWEYIPNRSKRHSFSDWYLHHVMFESESGKVQPVIQIASAPESSGAFTVIDNLRIYEIPKDSPGFRVLLDY